MSKELFGFIGFALNIVGNILTTKKRRSGWAVQIGAAGSWLVYGLVIDSSSNIISSAVFLFLYCRSWWKWRA